MENCPGDPCITNTVPGAPTGVVATAGVASASVAFVAPASTGGSVITGYTVTSSPAGGTATGSSSPLTVTGLTNGTAYTFTVVATNAVGSSAASAASSAVTPATVPGAPTGVVATAGVASASVAFVAPASTGGSVITGYTVTSSPAGGTATGSSSPLTVTGLTNGTAYTFTVVATNAVGNSVASAASAAVTPAAPFTCGTSTVSDVDNNSYNTVLIGTQCWTKENLKVTMYNDGSAIPLDATGGSTGTSSAWQNLTTGSYTIYGNESSNLANATNYGFLYNWYAAKGIITSGGTPTKNICPTGWHVPTDAEWTIMIQQLDNTASATALGAQSSTAGTLMKKNDVLWTPNTGTNTSGFSALPGGYRDGGGSFGSIRGFAFFWSATESGSYGAWGRYLYSNGGDVNGYNGSKSVGASVRCLRD